MFPMTARPCDLRRRFAGLTLTALAAAVSMDATGAKDAAKVQTMASAIRELAAATK